MPHKALSFLQLNLVCFVACKHSKVVINVAAVGSSPTIYLAGIWIAKHLRHFRMISKHFGGANECEMVNVSCRGQSGTFIQAIFRSCTLAFIYRRHNSQVSSDLRKKFMCSRFVVASINSLRVLKHINITSIYEILQPTPSSAWNQSIHQDLTAHTSRSFMIGLQTKSWFPSNFYPKFDNFCSNFSPFLSPWDTESRRI